MESVNEAKTYIVREKFALNMGEGQSKHSQNVSVGDRLKFDGITVEVGGLRGPAATLRSAITMGWLVEETSATPTPAAQAVPGQLPPTAQASQPAMAQHTRRALATDDYSREVSSTRSSKPSDNPSTVVTSSTETTRRGRATISEEENSVRAVRASTGAASPGKAAELGLMGKVASEPAPQPVQQQQYMQPPSRSRRSVVTDDATAVETGRALRATAAVNNAEISSKSNAGSTDAELAPATSAPGVRKKGSTSLSNDGAPVEHQAVQAVISTRRATSAVNTVDDISKVSEREANDYPQGRVAPMPEAQPVVASIRSARSSVTQEAGITSSVSVGAPGVMEVPTAKSSASDTGIIMAKTASVQSSDNSIYDPTNYLGLAGQQPGQVFKPVVASNVPSAAKKPIAKQAATQPAAEVQAPVSSNPVTADAAEEEVVDFGTENTVNKDIPMVLDHNGKLVPARKASIARTEIPETDVKEEDYSHMNEGLQDNSPSKNTKVGDNDVVPANFLDTFMLGGMLWAKVPHTAKIQFISGKRVGKKMVGGCNNLSILRLIKGQKGLQPSVLEAARERLEVLGKK
jgi:hypothetical protein